MSLKRFGSKSVKWGEINQLEGDLVSIFLIEFDLFCSNWKMEHKLPEKDPKEIEKLKVN